MGENTAIEWATHTFNPWWGCARVSPGCRFCYADRDASRYGHGDLWRRHGERRMLSDATWHNPVKWNRAAEQAGVPAKVFCASMADVFEDHPQVVDARKRLWDLIEATPWLVWQLLTKRPENVTSMVPWGDSWPTNIWLGTSVEDQIRADQRIRVIADLPGVAVRFLSCEPLLGPVDLGRALEPSFARHGWSLDRISWVIVGGESGPKARPMHPDWARSLRDQCVAAGVPFLFKQWGEWAPKGYGARINLLPGEQWRDTDFRPHKHWFPGPCPSDTRFTHSIVERVGKKAAGRELDGRTWDEYPEVAHA